MQLVHDHVVARPPLHRVHDDVLGPAGGVEEGELVLFGAEQAGEAGARARHGLATRRAVAAPHLVVRVAVEGVADGQRQRSHRGIVEVGEFLGDRKTGPDAERIARGGADAGRTRLAGWIRGRARERAGAGKRGQPGGRPGSHGGLEEASPIPGTAGFVRLHGTLLDGIGEAMPAGPSVRAPTGLVRRRKPAPETKMGAGPKAGAPCGSGPDQNSIRTPTRKTRGSRIAMISL